MKVLSVKYRETMAEWFGKKGSPYYYSHPHSIFLSPLIYCSFFIWLCQPTGIAWHGLMVVCFAFLKWCWDYGEVEANSKISPEKVAIHATLHGTNEGHHLYPGDGYWKANTNGTRTFSSNFLILEPWRIKQAYGTMSTNSKKNKPPLVQSTADDADAVPMEVVPEIVPVPAAAAVEEGGDADEDVDDDELDEMVYGQEEDGAEADEDSEGGGRRRGG